MTHCKPAFYELAFSLIRACPFNKTSCSEIAFSNLLGYGRKSNPMYSIGKSRKENKPAWSIESLVPPLLALSLPHQQQKGEREEQQVNVLDERKSLILL